MDGTKPTDDALVRAYREGNAEAFGALYDRYAQRVFGFVLSLGGPRPQAEEAVQTAWLKAVEALPRYRTRGRFQAWLFQIAYRVWLDQKRSAWERRRISIEHFGPDGADSLPAAVDRSTTAPSPEAAVLEAEQRDALYAALETLPEAMRQVILLRLDGELTYREIAQAMDAPLGTTLWRAREATKRLREALEDIR